jgi:hypothetical protein
MHTLVYNIKRFWRFLRFGTITSKIIATAGDSVTAEVEYYDRYGNVIGYWAYGYWHPKYPYQGE